MAAVQTRERSGSTRKPFGWIQRLYKKSSQGDVEHRGAINLEDPSKNSNIDSTFHEFGAASVAGSITANDMSSLRPTISTRAPSIAQSMASNAAIRNVDAISSAINPAELEMTPKVTDNGRSVFSHSPINDDETLVDNVRSSHVHPQDNSLEGRKTIEALEMDAGDVREDNRENRHDSQYTTSSYSSKESPMPSLFSSRTTETAPTISLFTHPASVISARTTNGPGAQDNASMLTLASSSKGPHQRRTSTDTNCSVRALAPASARGSFESSRTGLTDPRRFTMHNGHPILLDDGNTIQSIGPGRSRQPISENMAARRSVSGLSAVSVQSTINDED